MEQPWVRNRSGTATSGKNAWTVLELRRIQFLLQALLNGRSLTHLSMDPADLEPLTPNHFLLGRPNPNLPSDVIADGQTCFRRRWMHAQLIVNQVCKRWLTHSLREESGLAQNEVRTQTGVYTRPTVKLCLLESPEHVSLPDQNRAGNASGWVRK